MAIDALNHKTQIGVLRIQAGSEYGLAARLAISGQLSNMTLQPANIPPSAILIVQHMADPLPHRIPANCHTARLDADWERAARDALATHYRQASRPFHEPASAGAAAVVFGDQSEMLACLAEDMVQNQAVARWWWRVMLRGLPSPSTGGLATLLCRHAIQVPAVLYHLSQRRQAEAVVQRLSAGQASNVLKVVSQVYELPGWRDITAPAPQAVSQLPDAVKDADYSKVEQIDGAREHRHSPANLVPPGPENRFFKKASAAPWAAWLPGDASTTRLLKEQECLLGLGLSLYHAPASVRSEAFLKKLQHWWLTSASEESFSTQSLHTSQKSWVNKPVLKPDFPKDSIKPLSQEAPKTAQESSIESPASTAIPAQATASPDTINPALAAQNSQIHPAEQQAKPLPAEAGKILQEESRLRAVDGASAESISPPYIKSAPPETSIGEPELSDPESQSGSTEKPLLFENGVATQLGGVMYLINLMAQLDLPQCFDKEWRLAEQLGSWGVLEILARALLDEVDESLCHDPMWQALAELDGRTPGELPGAGFQGSGTFHLPAAWPGYVGDDADGAYVWGTDGHRYLLWSGQGYMLVEHSHINPLAELCRYFDDVPVNLLEQPCNNAPIAKLNKPLLAGLNPDLGRWLALVLPYLRLRLQLALRTTTDLQALLLQPGWLYLTSTHVDLVLSLNRVSIPVRLAGLDLDPGWVPDFGRVVLFHYE